MRTDNLEPGPVRLFVNVDHVATIREARKTTEPDPVEAALAAEDAGAHGITVHLREDRRHIQDEDVKRLKAQIRTRLNLEIAVTDEMLRIAEDLNPYQVTFVPERREELTTEGGLNLMQNPIKYEKAIKRMENAGIRVSLFLDPVEQYPRMALLWGARAIEIHTGEYARNPTAEAIKRLSFMTLFTSTFALDVNMGHGLTTENVKPLVKACEQLQEVNIGHHIISRAVMVGIPAAVKEMLEAIKR